MSGGDALFVQTPIYGTELVYVGQAAGTHYTHNGGGANYLCIPLDPEYLDYVSDTEHELGLLYGAEYQIGENYPNANNNMTMMCRVPCVTLMPGVPFS